MRESQDNPKRVLKRLNRVLALTRLGLLAESVTRCFWPVWSLLFVVLAALMFGVQDILGLETLWLSALAVSMALLWLVWRGARKFRWPDKEQAFARLDATLPGQPLQALRDTPAIGAGDAASEAIWQAHQARMADRARSARAPEPDLKISRLDPFGLRYVAVLAITVALLFGSITRIGSVADAAIVGGDTLTGPSWEGWVEPPAYTGKPALYLPDLPEGPLDLAEGSRILIRLYGEVGALTVAETVSGRVQDVPSAADPEQDFTVAKAGQIEIAGEGGRRWDIGLIPDRPPQVSVIGEAEVSGRGELSLPFAASDDYEVTGGSARISLDLESVPRRYGLVFEPEDLAAIEIPLPLPISGDRSSFEEVLIENFSKHPWAHLPVFINLTVQDASGQTGEALPVSDELPARRFFDPLAAAVVELRRDLLWSRQNAVRVSQLLRAVSHEPDEDMFPTETSYLRLRTILRRLENMVAHDAFGDAQREEITEAMWDLALMLEEGNLGDALERMERARERLAEAMKNGASDEEIARLMQELREATEDYMRELARRQQQEGGEEGDRQMSENSMTLNQDDLQRMMDRIQELMEEGRMAEAMQALEEFQRMMENMRVTQGQGNGEKSPGEQTMEGLSETLREQQGLSDEAFRELQEQFNPNANRGQSQDNEGYSGGEGRGQAHDGTGQGRGEGAEGESGQTPSEQPGLADRQQALRQQLENLRNQMPGRGTPEGDAAAEALGQAGEAMDNAEDALRGNDLAEAIDQQAQAMEAMREGMRNLGEALAQEQGQGQQGREQAGRRSSSDPLGRSQGARGPAGTDQDLLQGEDVYREARRLLDEIRRRAGEGERTEEERGYLRRLLERF